MRFLELKPVQNPDTVWRSVEEECIIITPRQSTAAVLNPVGTRVWELVDGKRSVSEIVSVISEEFDSDVETISEDVQEFLEDLQRRGLIILEGSQASQGNEETG